MSSTLTREVKGIHATPTTYSRYGKRALDFVGSLLGLIVLSPFLIPIACSIKLDSAGPIFFRQTRTGKHGRLFRIVKFRSMIASPPACSKSLVITISGDPRITVVGRTLRKYKLDELPQLWNVLLGDMSLVGPRPELPFYVNLYTPEQLEVLSVRPGITDPASLIYRNEECLLKQSSHPERFYCESVLPAKLSLNLKYIANISFANDILLILLTAKSMFVVSDSKDSR